MIAPTLIASLFACCCVCAQEAVPSLPLDELHAAFLSADSTRIRSSAHALVQRGASEHAWLAQVLLDTEGRYAYEPEASAEEDFNFEGAGGVGGKRHSGLNHAIPDLPIVFDGMWRRPAYSKPLQSISELDGSTTPRARAALLLGLSQPPAIDQIDALISCLGEPPAIATQAAWAVVRIGPGALAKFCAAIKEREARAWIAATVAHSTAGELDLAGALFQVRPVPRSLADNSTVHVLMAYGMRVLPLCEDALRSADEDSRRLATAVLYNFAYRWRVGEAQTEEALARVEALRAFVPLLIEELGSQRAAQRSAAAGTLARIDLWNAQAEAVIERLLALDASRPNDVRIDWIYHFGSFGQASWKCRERLLEALEHGTAGQRIRKPTNRALAAAHAFQSMRPCPPDLDEALWPLFERSEGTLRWDLAETIAGSGPRGMRRVFEALRYPAEVPLAEALPIEVRGDLAWRSDRWARPVDAEELERLRTYDLPQAREALRRFEGNGESSRDKQKDIRSESELVATLLGADPSARVEAARALRNDGDAADVRALIDALEALESPTFTYEADPAAEQTPRDSHPSFDPPIPLLDSNAVIDGDHGLLFDEPTGVRIAYVLQTLGERAQPAVPALARAAAARELRLDAEACRVALRNLGAAARDGMIVSLERVHSPAALGSLLAAIGPPTLQEFDAMRRRGERALRGMLAWIAGCKEVPPEIAEHLLPLLREQSPHLRSALIPALHVLGPSEIPRWIELAEQEPESLVALFALVADMTNHTNESDRERFVDPNLGFVLEILEYGEPEEREAARGLLGAAPLRADIYEETVHVLVDWAQLGSSEDELWAVRALGSINPPHDAAMDVVLDALTYASTSPRFPGDFELAEAAFAALEAWEQIPERFASRLMGLTNSLVADRMDDDRLKRVVARCGPKGLAMLVARESSGWNGFADEWPRTLEEAIVRIGPDALSILDALGEKEFAFQELRLRANLHYGACSEAHALAEARRLRKRATRAEEAAFAVCFLAQHGDEQARGLLAKLYEDEHLSEAQRLRVVRTWCTLRELPASREALMRIALHGDHAYERLIAVSALKDLSDAIPAVRDTLLEVCRRDPHPHVRRAATPSSIK